jgi:uncharacterized membrane protein
MNKSFNLFGRKVSLKMFNVEQTTNNKTEMAKLEKISAILGKDVTAETVLTVAELEQVENAMTAPTQEETTENTAPTAEEIAAAMTEPISTAVAAAMTPVQESINSIEQRLGALENSAGAKPTVTTPTNGASVPDYSAEPWLDPNNSINKHFDQQIGG